MNKVRLALLLTVLLLLFCACGKEPAEDIAASGPGPAAQTRSFLIFLPFRLSAHRNP